MTKIIPKEFLHTPSELLQGAEFLADSDNPTLWRAAVLEAFSALDTYVENAVSLTIESWSFSPLKEWLKKRLDDRLDSRLSMLAEVAVGRPMDDQLVKDFGSAKEIRNASTHHGKKVSAPEARKVIKTVYKLLGYLGSALELELTLFGLKRYIESNKISIKTHDEAVSVVRDYFGRNKAAYALTEIPRVVSKKGRPKLRCELILEFAEYHEFHILVETRLICDDDIQKTFATRNKDTTSDAEWTRGAYSFRFLPSVFNELVEEVNRALPILNLPRGIIIAFVRNSTEAETSTEYVHKGKIAYSHDYAENLKILESVQKYCNDRVYAIAIQV